jgi:hypothetical protein
VGDLVAAGLAAVDLVSVGLAGAGLAAVELPRATVGTLRAVAARPGARDDDPRSPDGGSREADDDRPRPAGAAHEGGA